MTQKISAEEILAKHTKKRWVTPRREQFLAAMEEYASQKKEKEDVEKQDLQAKEDKLKAVLNDWIISLEKDGYDIDFIESRMVSICLDHKLNLSR